MVCKLMNIAQSNVVVFNRANKHNDLFLFFFIGKVCFCYTNQ